MCIISGMGELEHLDPEAPIAVENGKAVFEYHWVQIVLRDWHQGGAKGGFSNEIASWTLRGLGEWMAKECHFREMTARVFHDQTFCGMAEVSLLRPAQAAVAATS